jgi:S1-C subfamily serine protease
MDSFIFGGPRVTQVNIRVSAGLVFMFGGRAPTGTRASEQRGSTSAPVAATSEAAGYATEAGLRVTSVRAGSPAAQAGINASDIISKIDGKEVHSSLDIESAIATNASGTVSVTYLIKGAWLAEREVKVR